MGGVRERLKKYIMDPSYIFGPGHPLLFFLVCLIELNVLIPKNKKLSRSDELRQS